MGRLRAETRQLVSLITSLSYFSRGSITYECAMEMTPFERDIVLEFQKKHIEQQVKLPHPVY